MGKSDALSCRSDHGSGTDDNWDLTLLTLSLFAIRALEGFQLVGEEKDILKEIRRGMDREDHEDVVVKAVKELKKSPVKSIQSSEWSMENGLLYYRGKVYVRGHSFRPSSQTEYLCPTTPDTFCPCNTLYIPPHHR